MIIKIAVKHYGENLSKVNDKEDSCNNVDEVVIDVSDVGFGDVHIQILIFSISHCKLNNYNGDGNVVIEKIIKEKLMNHSKLYH